VIVRDRACAWNGCDVPAAYCEIHHITWWDRDTGPTDYDNAALLCTHHHHVVHQHDLTLTRQPHPPGHDHDTGGSRRGGQDDDGRHGSGAPRPRRSTPLLPDEPVRYAFRQRGKHVLVNAPSPAAAGGSL
jgi:hypothetical protein